MKAVRELSFSEKVILLGNLVIAVGTMITSIGALMKSAALGELSVHSKTPCYEGEQPVYSGKNQAKSYFED